MFPLSSSRVLINAVALELSQLKTPRYPDPLGVSSLGYRAAEEYGAGRAGPSHFTKPVRDLDVRSRTVRIWFVVTRT